MANDHKRNSGFPKYSLHTPSGNARVKIDGHEIWLGRYHSPESRARYDQLIAEWLVAGLPSPGPRGDRGRPAFRSAPGGPAACGNQC